jgi:hypothetical protein
MLYDIRLTLTDIEKLASLSLGVPRTIDLGPAPKGGRYYCDLLEGISQLLSDDDLRLVVEEALSAFFRERRPEFRTALAHWVWGLHTANRDSTALAS